ncbi:MAG: hypothetical protein A2498_15280 [Lentisphaerae bacterium RIFOXYC12_FULL_60_16]|nr:MAG: hypothetical protein A2498_15280 [Lentisphaerae bacterium RIFOXYC12_FULL_60_16]OGV83757.1 MAG: hypothetical protein A2340_01770 [Lentisphaerae bacterium RIFOXYB12_FULL_60_10]
MGSRQVPNRWGFTLVEIMFAVAVIALLAGIALPSFIKARRRSQNTTFAANIRAAAMAFEQRSLESGGFPPDADPGVVPDGMPDYLSRMNWDRPTPVGGQWDWAPDVAGFGHGVRVVNADVDDARMMEIDEILDDGNLVIGMFRKLGGADGYIYRVE